MTTEPNEKKSSLRHYLEKVTGPLEDKKRYRNYRARVQRLPAEYRAAVEALQRYMTQFGPTDDAESLLQMLDDLVELFEQSAADRTPLRVVVGHDPAEFAEAFLNNYAGGGWVSRERDRLNQAIEEAAGDQ
ncbi:DUF1048 domain-containing protein [Nonomuraea sp. NPDC050310]|uniref:DUF1048 domain-containing protein n=1 Tax=unclassified Nonomuraea TaxID=2593643 RepID=UPI0033CE47C5